MFYHCYLSGLCDRRQWPDPLYEPYRTRDGYCCKVRVNNREYSTDVPYETEALARDGAAIKAYMICRNFSVNDGMFPGQRPGNASGRGGVVQGLPVAIGTGRRAGRVATHTSLSLGYDTDPSSEASSSPDSPASTDSAFDLHMHLRRPHAVPTPQPQPQPQPQHLQSRRGPKLHSTAMCYCRRSHALPPYRRCKFCLRDAAY